MAAALGCLLGGTGCGDTEEPFPNDDELSAIRALARIDVPPDSPTNLYAKDLNAIELGRQLFSDTGLSSCGTVACATCHPPANAFADVGNPLSTGCNGTPGRNTPTLLNASFREWFYWDGRKDSLWAHAILPLTRHIEMDAAPADVQAHLQANYATLYQTVFGKLPSAEADVNRVLANFGKAMEAYLRTLIKVQAPFDDDLQRFLQAVQDGTQKSDSLYLGLHTFVRKAHCIFCHKGALFSDNLFHNIGVADLAMPPMDDGRASGATMVLDDTWNGRSSYSDDTDTGSAKLNNLQSAMTDSTWMEEANGAFKTPSLRNVALTPPYMHTGARGGARFSTPREKLLDVIEFYNQGGDPIGTFVGVRTDTIVPLGLAPAEKDALVDLLLSLTGAEPIGGQ